MTRNPQQTRQKLLTTAFEEIHSHGFQGMRVDEVLRKTGLQKGAFYHHFKSKLELGYAVLDEQIQLMLETTWLEPLKGIENPLIDFPKLLASHPDRIPRSMRVHGCPLNNLAQEMASQDDGFQQRVAGLFDSWIKAYTQLFEEAQTKGYVRADIDAAEIARFLVGVLEGSISILKAERSPQQWLACQSQIEVYFKGLQA
ncbi:MAG: TetR/AcrR family transcriptional regulator [Thiotrichaceae bacterium]